MLSSLAAKILAGVSGALLLTLGIMWLVHRHDQNTINNQRDVISRQSAQMVTQNAAITRAGQEAAQQRQDFAAAMADGQSRIAETAGRVRIVQTTTRSGCHTPPQVMGAGL